MTNKMKLSMKGDDFIKYRIAISEWFVKNKTPVEIKIYIVNNKVQFLFDNTKDAWNFQSEFEDI